MELTYDQYRQEIEKYLIHCKRKGLDNETIARKTEILTRLEKFLGKRDFSAEKVNLFLDSLRACLKSSHKFATFE